MTDSHPVWQGSTALERLRRLAGATVSATSKEGTVKMSLTGPKLSVKLHPERIVRMEPAQLAGEVVNAFTGLLRGRQAAETKILSSPRGDQAGDELPRDRLRAGIAAIEATAASDSGRVSAVWRGTDGVQLTIHRIATRPSDREWLETDIADTLQRINRAYRDELRGLFQRIRQEAA